MSVHGGARRILRYGIALTVVCVAVAVTRSAAAPQVATPRLLTAALAPCVGDCDHDRVVQINELVTGVTIALGTRAFDSCLAFDRNDDGRVTIDELLQAVGNALGGCPKPDLVLQIVPGAVLLAAGQNTATLHVRAFDRAGNEVPLNDLAIEWLSSDDRVVGVVADAPGAAVATATLQKPIGTGIVTARLTADPEIVAPPVAVMRAKLHPDVDLVADADVVFPPPNLPDGVSLGADQIPDLEPANPGSEARLGGFSESELTQRFEVTNEFAVRYPIVLRGEPPAIGQRLLAGGGAAVAGVVRSVERRANFALAQLEIVPPQELFETLDFALSAEQLLAKGLLMPFDTSGWESDGGATDEAHDAPSTGSGGLIEVPVGPFSCKPVGLGIVPTFLQIPTGSHTYFGPVWDGALRIGFFEIQHFYIKAGLQARARFHPEIRLTQGVRVEATCDLRDDLRIKRTLPVNGPMAVLLAPYVEGLVSIPFKVTLSGGATSRYGMKLGFDYALWTGGTYTPADGWQPLCATWSDCSRRTEEAELIWDEDRSGSQMTIAGEAGLMLAGDAGIQAGGIIFDVVGKIPGLGGLLSGATRALEQKGKVPILRARLGPQGLTHWHNASRTAFIEESEAAANLVVQGDLNVRFDALNSYLQTALRLGGVRSIPLLSFPLFHFGEPYRVLHEETLRVNGKLIPGSLFSSPVEVRVGDVVSVVATVERDFINLSPITLFLPTLSLHQDFPYAGEIWGNGQSVGEMAPINEFTLSGTFTATQALCDAAAAGDGSQLQMKVLAFNRMFSLIPTANFVGTFKLRCLDTNHPPTKSPTARFTATSTLVPPRTPTRTRTPTAAVGATATRPVATPTQAPTRTSARTPTRAASGWVLVGVSDIEATNPIPGRTLTMSDGSAHYVREQGNWNVSFSWRAPGRIEPDTEVTFAITAQLASWDAFFGQIRALFDVDAVPPGPIDIADAGNLGGTPQAHSGSVRFSLPANAPDEIHIAVSVTDGSLNSGFVRYRYRRDG